MLRGLELAELGHGVDAGEDLLALRRRADPRRRVHALAVVVLLALEGAVGMDADAEVELELLRDGALDRDRGLHRLGRILEGGEEPVAGVVDDLAAVVGEDRAERLVMAAKDVVPVSVFECRGELGRADDVGEDECLHDRLRDVSHERFCDALSVAHCAEALEARRGCLELPDGGLLVSAGP